jgi:N-acylneuraminate cytidylyltransferase
MWFDGISYYCRRCQEILPWKYPYMPEACPECGFKGIQKPRTVALIPARKGSERIPNKNITIISGRPMIAWTILAAIESRCFDEIWCSTNDLTTAKIAEKYGAKIIMRPDEYAQNSSPDYLWVHHMYPSIISKFNIFSILRPTSPFRTADTIRRAFIEFFLHQPADSLRAVEKCKQHPVKMWRLINGNLYSFVPEWGMLNMHSKPTQLAPTVYVQNASLEIAWVSTFTETGDITGKWVIPFFTQGYEGFDINTPEDLILAYALLNQFLVKL